MNKETHVLYEICRFQILFDQATLIYCVDTSVLETCLFPGLHDYLSTAPFFFFFFFFFVWLLRLHPRHMEVPRLGVELATAAVYTTAHGNARSLTH